MIIKRTGNTVTSIDLNCDMGEGMGNDAAIMPYISSANIACGYHAGNETTIWETIQLAIKHKVAIGAHVSFLDKENFGRSEMDLPVAEIYELVTQQLIVIAEIASFFNARLHHVKPHGALYNMAARDKKLAAAIASAVKDFDNKLFLFGLSGSHSITEATKIVLRPVNEVFADRTYRDDGSLVPRSQAGALIDDAEAAIQQVLQLVRQQQVTTITGKTIPVKADTICLHSDGKEAARFAKAIHEALTMQGINIKKP